MHQRAFSETFIRQHVAHLPYRVSYAWGAYLGFGLNDETILPAAIARLPLIGNKLLEDKWVNIIRKQNIKLVLAEYGPVGVHWLPVCQRAGVPLLVYFHGFDATRGAIVSRYQLKYKELFGFASSIFVVSNPMRERLLQWGAPAHKLILNPCGADMSVFDFEERHTTEPIVLSVGRFANTKRPDLLIEAFAKVLKTIPRAKLRMIGAGEMLIACKQMVEGLGLGDSIQFLGVLTPTQVAHEMARARVFAQHSMTAPDGETEGAPVAIMEAGANGLPVVSTLHAGIPEIVEHGKTGYLVPEGDMDGMANYLIKLLLDNTLATEMGKAAAKRVAIHFSLEKNIRILTEQIQKHLPTT